MPVFDATALLHFLEPDAKPVLDPNSGKPLDDAKARIDLLIKTLQAKGETIVIPTPALSEVLVHAGDAGPKYLDVLDRKRCFRVEPFDKRAAVELAAITRDALAEGNLRAGVNATRAKLKFDRQIIAIAKTCGHTVIYSDDSDIAKLGGPLGLQVIPMQDLPKPPEVPQRELDLESESNT
ncbi:hypothetical protein [Candidatus Foliamicus sp.]